MTPWLRDVLHVMRYDARALWPFFALHVAALVYGVLQARGLIDITDSTDGGTFLLYGSAMLFSALLIHRHTPASHSAHWGGLPYERSAVWAAKWIMLALLLAVGTTALLIAVNGQPDPNGVFRHFTYARAASLSAAIAAAALVASIKRELRTVLLLLLALPFISGVCLLLTWLLLPDPVMFALFHPFAVFIATILASLASWWLYKERGVSSTSVTRMLLGTAMLFAGVITTRDPGVALLPNDLSTVRIRESIAAKKLAKVNVFAERDTTSNAADYRSLRLSMKGAPTDLRAEWMFSAEKDDAEALLRLTPSVVLASSDQRRLWTFRSELFTPALPITPSPRWLSESFSDSGTTSAQAATPLNEWFVQAGILSEIDQAKGSVDGAVRFSQPIILTRMQLAAGGQANVHGQQWRIVERGGNELLCEHEQLAARCGIAFPHGSLVRLRLLSTFAEPDASLSFALVNAARSEAVELTADWTNTRRHSPGLMFLPSSMRMTDWLLVPNYYGGASGQLDEAWLRGAELVIVRWEPVGALPVPIRSAVTTSSSAVARSR